MGADKEEKRNKNEFAGPRLHQLSLPYIARTQQSFRLISYLKRSFTRIFELLWVPGMVDEHCIVLPIPSNLPPVIHKSFTTTTITTHRSLIITIIFVCYKHLALVHGSIISRFMERRHLRKNCWHNDDYQKNDDPADQAHTHLHVFPPHLLPDPVCTTTETLGRVGKIV